MCLFSGVPKVRVLCFCVPEPKKKPEVKKNY